MDGKAHERPLSRKVQLAEAVDELIGGENLPRTRRRELTFRVFLLLPPNPDKAELN